MDRTPIRTTSAPASTGGSSQAIAYGDLLFTGAQLPIDPATGQMLSRPFNPVFSGAAAADQAAYAQMRQCLANLEAICRAAGTELSRALRLTIYLDAFGPYGDAVDRACRDYFPADPPARVMLVSSPLQGNALVQVDAIVALT